MNLLIPAKFPMVYRIKAQVWQKKNETIKRGSSLARSGIETHVSSFESKTLSATKPFRSKAPNGYGIAPKKIFTLKGYFTFLGNRLILQLPQG